MESGKTRSDVVTIQNSYILQDFSLLRYCSATTGGIFFASARPEVIHPVFNSKQPVFPPAPTPSYSGQGCYASAVAGVQRRQHRIDGTESFAFSELSPDIKL
jgi:hypothetical protein